MVERGLLILLIVGALVFAASEVADGFSAMAERVTLASASGADCAAMARDTCS